MEKFVYHINKILTGYNMTISIIIHSLVCLCAMLSVFCGKGWAILLSVLFAIAIFIADIKYLRSQMSLRVILVMNLLYFPLVLDVGIIEILEYCFTGRGF